MKIERITRKMILILGTAILALCIWIPVSSAFNKNDLEKVKKTKACEACNLRGAVLPGADLAGANLAGAQLVGANLRGADLSNANLSRANLADAVLADANLSGADLSDAKLRGAYLFKTNFSHAIWTDGKICKEGSIGKCEKGGKKKTSLEGKARDSYSLGYEFGANLRRRGVEIDKEVLISSIRDALEGKTPSLSAEEIRETLRQLRRNLEIQANKRFNALKARNLEEGKKFLEANKTRKGVKTLPSGLQYQVLKEGEGRIPNLTDSVVVDYRGTTIDGKEFDSTYRRKKPMTIPLAGVIKGWTEALQRMKVGSKWQLFVPPSLGYGKRRFGRIPPNSTLIFELELLAVAEGPVQGSREPSSPKSKTAKINSKPAGE